MHARRSKERKADLRAAEGQAVFFQLQHGTGRFLAHVVNGVLVAEPVATFYSVVHVPPPVVFGHVAERGVDAALRGHRVGAGREELGDAHGAEASFSGAHGRTQACA